jgi:hypothetical protein
LKKLSLWRVTASTQSTFILTTPFNYWTGFFESLSKIPGLQLNHILAGQLHQVAPAATMPVKFRIPDPTSATEASGQDEEEGVDVNAIYMDKQEHSGKDTMEFVKRLAKTVHVDWPQVISSDSSEDEDEDGEEEDGEDGEDEEDE